jgi:hypothetical protein
MATHRLSYFKLLLIFPTITAIIIHQPEQFCKNHVTQVLQTCLQVPLTPSENCLKRSQNVIGCPYGTGQP